MRFVLLLAALGIAVVPAAASAERATTSETGLTGKALRGPVTPVCRSDRPCYAPYRGVLVFVSISPGAATSGTFRTQAATDGDYRIALEPARYRVLTPRASRFGGLVVPAVVGVPASGMRRVNLLVDTGIR